MRRLFVGGLAVLGLACSQRRALTGVDAASDGFDGAAAFDARDAGDSLDARDTSRAGEANDAGDANDASDARDASDAGGTSDTDASDAGDASDTGSAADADVDAPPNVSPCGRATRPLQTQSFAAEVVKQIADGSEPMADGDGFAWLELAPQDSVASIWWWRPGDPADTFLGATSVLRGDTAPYLLENTHTLFVHSSDATLAPPGTQFRSLTIAVDRQTGIATTFRDVMGDGASPTAADDDYVYFTSTTRIFALAADGSATTPAFDIQLPNNGGFVRDGASLYVVDGGSSAPVLVDGGAYQQQLVADGRLLRYPLAGGAPDTLLDGLVMPRHPMLFGDDIYFDLRRCTDPGYAQDTIAIVSRSGGPMRTLPIADEVVGSSSYRVDARHGVTWVGWVEVPSHIVRNYRTSLDGRTVTKLDISAEAPWDIHAEIIRVDDTFAWAWLPGQIVRWPDP